MAIEGKNTLRAGEIWPLAGFDGYYAGRFLKFKFFAMI
jgi:hypothetical protein